MIKRILDTTKDKLDDVMISVLLYIDTTLDKHEDRLDKNDERMKSFEDKLTEFDKNFDSMAIDRMIKVNTTVKLEVNKM